MPGMKFAMQRRIFLLTSLAGAWIFSGCRSAGPAVTEATVEQRRRTIDAGFYTALERLHANLRGSRELVERARGVLLFPTVVGVGVGPGGQYGEGLLRVANAMEGYYSMSSPSPGSQADTQGKAVMYLFMTQQALDKFRSSKEWSVGEDASVAVLKPRPDGGIDPDARNAPVLAIILADGGAIIGMNLNGARITPLEL